MATLHCTHVFQNGDIYRTSGETVVVDGTTYVKRPYANDLESADRFHPTQEVADQVAAIKIHQQIARLHDVLSKLRPLPAGNQAAAQSSAAGGAQAVVAT
jgi:ornithine carbamoyltransferase